MMHSTNQPVISSLPPMASIRRRLICGVYEVLLLFAVLFVCALFLGLLGAAVGPSVMKPPVWALQLGLLLLLGGYFGYFWSHGGQTTAMRAWRLRLVSRQGQSVTGHMALKRYAWAWLLLLPVLLAMHLSREWGLWTWALWPTMHLALYCLMARLHPLRQWPHDVLSRTLVVHERAERP